MIKRLLILCFTLAAFWLVPVSVSAAPAYFAGVMELIDEQEVDVVPVEGRRGRGVAEQIMYRV